MGLKELKAESYSKEAILCGLFWNNPSQYDMYNEEKINKSSFLNGKWSFFFGLGRYLYEEKKVTDFDDLTVHTYVNELNLNEKYKEYGGYEIIEEIMEETETMEMNFNAYYEDVKKYALLKGYLKLFGEKVLATEGVYDYKKLRKEEISAYWNDKLLNVDMQHNENKIVAYNVLANLEQFIDDIDENADIGMPFYKSKKFTDIYSGWALGTLSIFSAFSGNGKTSFVVEKIIMNCIIEKEKIVIIANEMDLKQYQKYLFITIMGNELYEKFVDNFKKPSFVRKNINRGNFTAEEKAKLKMAVEWVKEKTQGDESLIKFVPLEDYTMENVEMTIKKFNRRGYKRYIIDTAKPSEKGVAQARWETFVSDFDCLYKLARKDAGGLGVAIWATVQSADNYTSKHWLNEQVLADSKKIKNVADGLFMIRVVFPQEYEGGNRELEVINWIPRSEDQFNQDEREDEDNPNANYIKQKKKLKHGKVYYIMFVPKNRRGQTNLTGLDPLVFEVNFNNNSWREVGYAVNVHRDEF